jgi:hypothetical protein
MPHRQVMANVGQLSIDDLRALANGKSGSALGGQIEAEVRGSPNGEVDSQNEVP